MLDRDALLTQVIEQIVRPHLVGEVTHDCAFEISKDLDEWRQRLRDGTACGSCGGTGVCADCNGFGCVACDRRESDKDALGECQGCKGSGARRAD